MKKLLSFGVAFLFIVMTAIRLSGNQHRGGYEGLQERFIDCATILDPGPNFSRGKLSVGDAEELFHDCLWQDGV